MAISRARRLVCVDVLGKWLDTDEALAAVDAAADMFQGSAIATADLVRRLTSARIPRGALFSRLAPSLHALEGKASLFDDSGYLDPLRMHLEAVQGCAATLGLLASGQPELQAVTVAVVTEEMEKLEAVVGVGNALGRRLQEARGSAPGEIPAWVPFPVLQRILQLGYARSCTRLGPSRVDRLFFDALAEAGSRLSLFDIRLLL